MLLDDTVFIRTSHHAMGTVMSHKAYGRDAEQCLAAVCGEVEWLECLLSRFLPESDISRINLSAGIEPEKIRRESFEVLSKAVDYARWFPGCFDITIGPLAQLWRQAKESLCQPDDDNIQQMLKLVDFRDLTLDPWEMTAKLKRFGQSIDLGGIGKGYTGDKIIEVYQEFGVTSAYSNLGGNVVTLGTKPDGTPWKVGIQHPRDETKIMGAVAVSGQTVVTSGDYQRYFTDSRGMRHHHILDPRTGYPADSGLISVSIITENSMRADALSTIVFIAGLEKGLEILSNYEGTDAVLIDMDLQVSITSGLKERFEPVPGISVNILS